MRVEKWKKNLNHWAVGENIDVKLNMTSEVRQADPWYVNWGQDSGR